MQLETERLLLRPVARDDTNGIADVVFSDPNVVGMLAHNTRDPDDAYFEAKRWTQIMGIDGDGGIWDDGGMGLFAVLPKSTRNDLAGVAGFYMERNEAGRWNGEYFYAIGSNWHGLGLMSEVADLFGQKLRAMGDLGVVYAAYWDMINEASGRLLERTGLARIGRRAITDEYPEDRCKRMFDYDLWRLSEAKGDDERDRVLVQAARRAGGFVAENVVERAEALSALGRSYGERTLTNDAMTMFERALHRPGMAYFEIRGEGDESVPVNRLG